MGMYVLLSVSLRQKGSAESRPFDPSKEEERIEKGEKPWPVRAGGIWLKLYEHSLAIAFTVLFLLSFADSTTFPVGASSCIRLKIPQ